MSVRLCNLVSVKSLATKVRDGTPKNLRILDGTLLPNGSVARGDFESKHIPGAQLFDFNKCRDINSPYLNMLPTSKVFAQYTGSLGISNTDDVVVYDNIADARRIFSAPRLWWMFKVFGHDNVSILDGGLAKWITDGNQVTQEVQPRLPTKFEARYRPEMVIQFEDILKNLATKEYAMIDSRPAGRFNGIVTEPNTTVRPGHMPDAINIPFTSIRDEQTGLIKTDEELKALFSKFGVSFSSRVLATCSMGVTACCISFAAHLCGADVPVYDGSWMEYHDKAPDKIKIFPQDREV